MPRGLVTPSLIAANNFDSNIAGELDSGRGGGIYLDGSEATLQGNEILNNAATGSGPQGKGGGVFVEGGSVTIRGNALTRNTGGRDVASSMGYGGGMVISDTVALVQDNLITGNRATNSPDFALGGGVYAFTSTVRIVGNTISENSLTTGLVGFGGGLYLHYSPSTVDGNTITDNKAGTGLQGRGGGVRLAFCPAFTLTNNIIARNAATEYASGVGVAVSTGWIAHNTIADNSGGDGSGVHVSSSSDCHGLWQYHPGAHGGHHQRRRARQHGDGRVHAVRGQYERRWSGRDEPERDPGPGAAAARLTTFPSVQAPSTGVPAGLGGRRYRWRPPANFGVERRRG